MKGKLALALISLTLPGFAAQPPRWDYLGEGRAPARLGDCHANARLTVSHNNGQVVPWQRFCYYGGKLQKKRRGRK